MSSSHRPSWSTLLDQLVGNLPTLAWKHIDTLKESRPTPLSACNILWCVVGQSEPCGAVVVAVTRIVKDNTLNQQPASKVALSPTQTRSFNQSGWPSFGQVVLRVCAVPDHVYHSNGELKAAAEGWQWWRRCCADTNVHTASVGQRC